MVLCFPSLVLFVVCCPDRNIREPAKSGCPVQYLVQREECCTPEATEAFLDYYRKAEFNSDNTPQGISLLEAYLRDVSPLNMEAWRWHARLSADFASAKVDAVKNRAVQLTMSQQELAAFVQTCTRASRAVQQALSRLENFQQFLIWHKASATSAPALSLDPEEIREGFGDSLAIYKRLVVEHDFLAYTLLPSLDRLLRMGSDPLLEESWHTKPVISILVIMVGPVAKMGFNTIWTILRYRSTRIRIHVFGDQIGFEACRRAVSELNATAEGAPLFRGVSVEFIEVVKTKAFRRYMMKHSQDCKFGAAGREVMARVICHELLPKDVHRVVSVDLGDVLVLEDILDFWKIGDELEEHQMLAAANAVSLYHINGGVVLYEVWKMRQRNFSSDVLQAAWAGLKRIGEGSCLRDQSIINILNGQRDVYGFEGPSPVRELPCRWSLFPTTEWVPFWNELGPWLPEIRERRRYPGIISDRHVEYYCPDEMDMLSNFAFLPISEPRAPRVSMWAQSEGLKKERYCSDTRPSPQCCTCKRRAALVHVAGDMKRWPAMRGFLRAHLPLWSEKPEDELEKSPSSVWWGGDERTSNLRGKSQSRLHMMAKEAGFNYVFPRGKDTCHTFTTPGISSNLEFYASKVSVQLPAKLEVETTAERDIHVQIHVEGVGIEIVAEETAHSESGMAVRMVQGAAGTSPVRYQMKAWDDAKVNRYETLENTWARFYVELYEDTSEMLVEVKYEDANLARISSRGSNVPEAFAKSLRSFKNLAVTVGTPVRNSKWSICSLVADVAAL
mmetsp:Transcript_8021/g.17892  ORF Transcript_8021/g.17892 Transcript_8021/m.17892 type:complete len:786 (+) Transcript_8021:218-2575(+)